MNRVSLFFQSLKYSFRIVYLSSKLEYILYLFVTFVVATLPLVNVYLFKYILDGLVGDKDFSSIFVLISFYIIIIVSLLCLNSIKDFLYNSLHQKANHKYDLELTDNILKLPLHIIDSSEGRDMIEDIQHARDMAVNLSFHMIRVMSMAYSFVVAFVTIFTFNIWFSLLFLILTIPGVVLELIFDKKNDTLRRKTAPDVRKFSYYRWMLTDAWPAKDVRTYDLTEPIKGRYDEEKEIYRKENKKLDKKKLYASIVSELIMRSGEIAFTFFVVYEAFRGKLTIGDVSLYTGLAITATISFESVIGILCMGFIRTTEVMNRFFEFIRLQSQSFCSGRIIHSFESMEFKNVYFKYPTSDIYVLKDVNFSLKKGERMALIGVNGSGKTTIVKLILGLYSVSSGEILINGVPLNEYDIYSIRKLFSVLFQNYLHYPLTLRENISLSDISKMDDDDEIKKALIKSGLAEDSFAHMVGEKGLNTYLTRQFDDEGLELSKGQWQKIAIARVYFKNSPVVIFDEPSASLDAEAEDLVFENFRKVSDSNSAILISHRISAARACTKIAVLNEGTIVEQGTHEELMHMNGLYSQFYNLQRKKYEIPSNS